MTPLRKREQLESELLGLRSILRTAPEDPLATPLLRSRIEDLQDCIRSLPQRSPIPQTELFFSGGKLAEAEGLEISFASTILNSYQEMLRLHFADRYRSKSKQHRYDPQLLLTALPRGSFGMQLSVPSTDNPDYVAPVSKAMQDISNILAAFVEGGRATEQFQNLRPLFLRHLERFLNAVREREANVRLVTGLSQVALDAPQIRRALENVRQLPGGTNLSVVKDAIPRREIVLSNPPYQDRDMTMRGIFGGILIFSSQFDFLSDDEETIRGVVSPGISEQTMIQWNQHFTNKRVLAKIKLRHEPATTSGWRRIYELISVETLREPPTPLLME